MATPGHVFNTAQPAAVVVGQQAPDGSWLYVRSAESYPIGKAEHFAAAARRRALVTGARLVAFALPLSDPEIERYPTPEELP